MQIHYLNHRDFSIDLAHFSSYIERLSAKINAHQSCLNVVFVTDAYIQALNKAYRGFDRPTDVLSFNYEQEELLGEVYISFETAERQAKEHNHSTLDELLKLLVHGILHLHHYDHEEDEDYKKMFAIEKEVLGDIAGEMIHS